MIIVSGCPRSGTSLMMLLHKEAMGEDSIIGTKWPMDKKTQDEHINNCLEYIKIKQEPDYQERLKETKKMNPNGFWECPWTTAGIQWAPNTPIKNKVVKIVSQGLSKSNPKYVDKIIMMIRHPWAVANSQRDLILPLPLKIRSKEMSANSPDMFIEVTAAVSSWIIKHNPDLLMVEFEELISNPDDVLKQVGDFVGEGDWNRAKNQIRPNLKRSPAEKPDERPSWDHSVKIYELFKEKKYKEVVDYYKSINKEKQVSFYCPRKGRPANNVICHLCKTDDSRREKLIGQAENRGIEWENEPCLWECGMNPDRDSYTPLTIEESIKNNHWINRQESSESTDKYAEFNLARTQFSTSDIDKSEGMIDAKECSHCEDFDSNKYHLMLKNVNVFDDCFKLEFDINDHKSVRFEMVEDININHILTQQRNPCLWSKTLPNFLVKYYNTKDACEETSEKIDLVDVHIYLEKISKTRWYFSVSADGGFDLFASVASSEEGKCLGTVEFLNELTKDTPFRETDSILQNQSAKRVFSTGRAIGYEGIALVSCGTED